MFLQFIAIPKLAHTPLVLLFIYFYKATLDIWKFKIAVYSEEKKDVLKTNQKIPF